MLTQPRSARLPLVYLALIIATLSLFYSLSSGMTGCARAATCLAGEDAEFTGTLTVGGMVKVDETSNSMVVDAAAIRQDSSLSLAFDSRAGVIFNLDTDNNQTGRAFDIREDASTDPTFRFIDGQLFINDTSNSFMTRGATLNQADASNEILTFKQSGVSHNMTSLTAADTYGAFARLTPDGGATLRTYTGATRGFELVARVTTELTTKSTNAGIGAVTVVGQKSDGAGSVTDMGANANIFTVQNNSRTVFIVDAEGDLHVDGSDTLTTFDNHRDVELLRSLRSCTNKGRDAKVTADVDNRPLVYSCGDLEGHGFISSVGDDEAPFVNMTAAGWLTMDAIRQVAAEHETRMNDLEAMLSALNARLGALETR